MPCIHGNVFLLTCLWDLIWVTCLLVLSEYQLHPRLTPPPITTVAMIIAFVSVINLLIGIQNIKLAKALKFENKQYTELILKKFDEN